jgi:hypothetical protein
MKEETEQNVNEAINWLQETGGLIQSFASEQAPIYCREVISWKKMEGVMDFGVGILFAVAAAFFFKMSRKLECDSFFREVACPGIGFICCFFAPILAISGVTSFAKASFAPRVVIVEHLKDLNQTDKN